MGVKEGGLRGLSFAISALLVIAVANAVYTGWKRGILGTGRWVLSMILGLIAVPLVSPFVESILLKSPAGEMLGFGMTVLIPLEHYVLRGFVFVISATAVQALVKIFTDRELPKAAQYIDKVCGAAFGGAKICMFIWLVEWLLQNDTYRLMETPHEILQVASIYRWVCSLGTFLQQ